MRTDCAYQFLLAGYCVECRFLYPKTVSFFHNYPYHDGTPSLSVKLTALELSEAVSDYESGTLMEYIEYCELSKKVSDALLPYRCCMFHCAAIIWDGNAYAFTAPSGTGKTTHAVLWKLLYGSAVDILNGDKPILEIRDDSSPWLHPSPWKGKEGMGTLQSAPLAGIILLEQGAVNQMRRLSAGDAALPIHGQFLFSRNTARQMYQAFAIEEALLSQVPVWHLINQGNRDAARLCHNTILGASSLENEKRKNL